MIGKWCKQAMNSPLLALERLRPLIVTQALVWID